MFYLKISEGAIHIEYEFPDSRNPQYLGEVDTTYHPREFARRQAEFTRIGDEVFCFCGYGFYPTQEIVPCATNVWGKRSDGTRISLALGELITEADDVIKTAELAKRYYRKINPHHDS